MAKLVLARSVEERQQRIETAQKLLSAPLGQSEAVRLALVNSQALQALLAQDGRVRGGRADRADRQPCVGL